MLSFATFFNKISGGRTNLFQQAFDAAANEEENVVEVLHTLRLWWEATCRVVADGRMCEPRAECSGEKAKGCDVNAAR